MLNIAQVEKLGEIYGVKRHPDDSDEYYRQRVSAAADTKRRTKQQVLDDANEFFHRRS